jgi:hypothetical protein
VVSKPSAQIPIELTTEIKQVKVFQQHLGTKSLYHLDLKGELAAHPSTKPTWTLEHFRGDGPTAHVLADIEVSSDGLSARLSAHRLPGRVEVSVILGVEPRTTLRDKFAVELLEAPSAAEHPPVLRFSQYRNGPLA